MRTRQYFRSAAAVSAVAAVLISGPTLAQEASAQAPDAAAARAGTAPTPRNEFGDIVVTATRRSDTVNRIPLSISAVTQDSLDQQGIETASDLQQVVPALTLVNQTAGVATFAIRGIVATTGAATTGVYLDDTALTKRNNPGVAQNNGAPLPTLFDLERVEVLKGPQGTLYGGSSQGGTIRFITPTPSLIRYSGTARAELSTVKDGEPSYELGAAVGGPLIEDRLGFRVSGIYRETGGWIDVLDPYDNGSLVREDANSRTEWAVRGALKAQLGEVTSATLAWYHSKFTAEGGPSSVTDVYTPTGQRDNSLTFTTPAVCYDNSSRPPGAKTPPAAVACPAVLPAGYFRREAQTYGPFDYLGRDDSIAPYDGVIPESGTRTDVGTLTVDHDIGDVTIRSITSYINDATTGNIGEGHDASRIQTTMENPGPRSFPLFAPQPVYAGRFVTLNKRDGFQQEVRAASTGDAEPLSWVVGAFYSKTKTNIDYQIIGNYDAIMLQLYGLTSEQRYGIPNTGGFNSSLSARLTDEELAAFGEFNYSLTEKLRVTAGLRVSRVSLDFDQENYGQLSSRPSPDAPFGRATGKRTDTPITPKVGLQYRITDDGMLYANAAKGFRAGGINVPLNPQVCAAGLALFGLTVNDIPTQYGPDTVWSYEVGGKFRLLDNRLQLNVAAFRIDWTDVQVTTSAQGCGQNWNQNGGSARSQGFDLQVDFRPTDFLTINASGGYTDASYTEPVLGPQPLVGEPAVTFNEGDPLGVPKWQLNVGTRFDFEVAEHQSYLRLDYQFQGKYKVGSGFGTGNYNPFTSVVPATGVFNLRSGIELDALEFNLFVNNLFNSRDRLGNAGNGRTGCNVATGGVNCDVYSFYNPFVAQQYQRPRSIGVQANYDF